MEVEDYLRTTACSPSLRRSEWPDYAEWNGARRRQNVDNRASFRNRSA